MMKYFKEKRIKKEKATLYDSIDRISEKVLILAKEIRYWETKKREYPRNDFYEEEIKTLVIQKKALENKCAGFYIQLTLLG